MRQKQYKKPARGRVVEREAFLGALARPAPVAMAVIAALTAAAAARAADTADTVAGPADSLEEVVVTASKRSESMQNVPITITALDAKTLEQKNIQDFKDYASSLPQVSFQENAPGQAVVVMRGISSGGFSVSGSQPTVGLYLDEQPITTNLGSIDMHMYDIARVEVLPGPQGTLYGASSESGTIRVISNKPDTSGFKAGYSAQLNTVTNGTVGGVFEGFVNVPLTDWAAVRLVGWYERDSGYIDNVHQTISAPNAPGGPLTFDNSSFVQGHYNPKTVEGGRLAAKFDIGDNWTISPTLITQKTRWDGIFGQENWNEAGAESNQYPFYASPSTLPSRAVAQYAPQISDDTWVDASLTVQGKIGNFDITYAGSYLTRDEHSSGEYSNYTLAYQQYTTYWPKGKVSMLEYRADRFKMYSNELRIASPSDWPVRFVAGAFQDRQRNDGIEPNEPIIGVNPAYEVGAGTPYAWNETWWLTAEQRVDRDYAVFTEANWDITSKLTFTAGIRRFWYDNTLEGFYGFGDGLGWTPGVATCTNFNAHPLGVPCENVNEEVSDKGWTPKFNLSYKLTPDAMVYLTYSKGFRPGGINRLATQPPYVADFLKNYEAGWKTSWFNNRLRFNGSLYYEQWQNLQFSFPGPFMASLIANAGAADVKGAEVNVDWVPLPGLTLSLGSTYNNAKLTENYCGTVDANGNPIQTNPCVNKSGTVVAAAAPIGTRLPYTPLIKTSMSARYEFPLFGQNGFIQADEVYQSWSPSAMKASDEAALGEIPAYALTNMFFGIDHGNWTAQLMIKNVFDRNAVLSRYGESSASYGFATYSTVQTPRTIGVQFSQKF